MSDKPPVEKTPDPSQTPEPTPGQPIPKQTEQKGASQASSGGSNAGGDRTVMHVTNDKPITDKLADIFKGDKPAAPEGPPRPSTPKSDTLPRKPAPLAEPQAAPKTDPLEVEAAKLQAKPAKSETPPTPAPASAAPVAPTAMPSAPAPSPAVAAPTPLPASSAPALTSPAPAPTSAPVEPSAADLGNPYIFSGEVDRARLVRQSQRFKTYLEQNARAFLGENIKRILDIGCGEGQLTFALARLFPNAEIIGVDRDATAIDAAQHAIGTLRNVRFVVGDILQSLPEGPFDLVYASVVLMHVQGTPKLLKSIYDVLSPGGYLWAKDLHPDMETAIDHPAFVHLSNWIGTTMDRIGSPWRLGAEMPQRLSEAGFNLLRTDIESFTLGTRNVEERITMAINLGAIYNARKLIVRVLQVPESDIEAAYKELVAAMSVSDGPRGDFRYVNTLAQKPEVELKPASQAAPAGISAETSALPDIENPYMLSGEFDRARLVAQSRFFRTYIEGHAKEFVGENIKRILDIGCGEGQLTMLFARLYPDAKVVGIDRDEKAIETARHAAVDLKNVSFEVGDIQERLPDGPFDLIYESIVLFHVQRPRDVVKNIYQALAPGGYFWSKNMHPMIRTAINHPAYLRLFSWVDVAMGKIGAHVDIAEELPGFLDEAGFSILKREREVRPIGNMSTEGRIMMAVNLGALYNARKLASKMTQVPESDFEATYRELLDAMMAPGGTAGEYVYINSIAQRPRL